MAKSEHPIIANFQPSNENEEVIRGYLRGGLFYSTATPGTLRAAYDYAYEVVHSLVYPPDTDYRDAQSPIEMAHKFIPFWESFDDPSLAAVVMYASSLGYKDDDLTVQKILGGDTSNFWKQELTHKIGSNLVRLGINDSLSTLVVTTLEVTYLTWLAFPLSRSEGLSVAHCVIGMEAMISRNGDGVGL